jgi:hypothetical protein
MSEEIGWPCIDKDKLIEILEEMSSIIYSIYNQFNEENSTYDPTSRLEKLIDKLKNE